MHNKKIIAKGLLLTTVMTNTPVESLANTIEEYEAENINKNTKINSQENGIKKFFAKIVEPIEDLINEPKDVIKVNPNIRANTVLEIRLTDSSQFVQDLSGNPGAYETVKVITEGDKKLVKQDYDNLRLSGIPKIDLSSANSDSIPAGAFSNATHLTEFKFPQGITSIGGTNSSDGAFKGCSGLTGNLVIPDTVVSIGDYAFSGCSGFTGNLTIPNSVTSIGNDAFSLCEKFTGDLVIPEGVITIGNDAFHTCRGFNGRLVLPSTLISIGNSAFTSCSNLTGDLIIPNNVQSMGYNVFRYCRGFNGRLVLSESLTSIGGSTFMDCTGLTGDLIIPDRVISMGSAVFNGCNGIEKIIVKIDEGDLDTNYRKSIIEKLPVDKIYVEMSYNFDDSGTWLETTGFIKAKPVISVYAGRFENNEGMGVTLDIIEASDIKTMTIMKDGENYTLEKSENGKYIFNEVGNYEIYIETELGTISNISFKSTSPMLKPSLNLNDNSIIIVNNGILSNTYIEKENSSEDFNSSSNLKFDFSNSNWVIENGVLKSEKINNSSSTENEFKVNAEAGDKLQISIKTSSESGYDWGYIYLNGVEVYEKSGTSTGFEVLDFDLQEGENVIKFKYTKDGSGSNGDDAIFIDYIKIVKNEITTIDCDTLEYRINDGDWQTYTDAFELNYPAGTKVLVEVRAKHDGFVSSIFSQEVTVELNYNHIKDAVEKAVQSRKPIDISTARDLVNQMPESSKKDEFQDRLDAIHPNLTLDKQTSSANLDVYIKSENMLSLSLDTNSITFEEYSGAAPMELKEAVNININSSLPYSLNAYMPSEITSSDGSKTMPIDILNIKEGTKDDYQTFADTTNKVVLKSYCIEGNNINHKIDLKLDNNNAHVADIYKTVIKFEAEQK